MKRRTFLKNTATAAAATALLPKFLKGKSMVATIPNSMVNSLDGDNIVIIVEMFGGNDGLNTIVPVYNDKYYNLRPTLNYPANQTRRFQTSDIYMSPAIVDNVINGGMMRLLETGRLAIIEGVGYQNPSLSHFRSEDIHLSGYNSSDPKQPLLEGWLGRYLLKKLPNYPLEIPEHPIAVNVEGSMSLLFKTNKGHMAIACNDPYKFAELGQGLKPNMPLKSQSTLFGDEFNFVHVIAEQADAYSKAIKDAYDKGKDKLQVQYSDSSLSQKFKLISSLIAGGLKSKVYFVKLSNFDSHAQQMTADYKGQHPTLLNNVACGICEFMEDAQRQGYADRLAGFTISEFGRRAYDNGSRGTDHGAASMQFVFTGNSDYINAGYFGQKPDLDNLDANGNIVYQHEFRRTFVDFLVNWLGAEKQDIVDVFGEEFLPIGVLKPRICVTGVEEIIEPVGKDGIKAYPNPSRGHSTLVFTLKKPAVVDVAIHNIPGYLVKKLHSGYLEAGEYKMPFFIDRTGTFIASVTSDCKRYVTKITIVK